MMNPGKRGQQHSQRRNVKVNLGAWRQGQQKAKGGTNSKGTPKSGFWKAGKGWRFFNHRTGQVTNAKKGPGKNARVFGSNPMRGKNAWLAWNKPQAKGPGAPSPTATTPGAPSDGPPVDLRDSQYWADYAARENQMNQELAPLEAELERLQRGGMAEYNAARKLAEYDAKNQSHAMRNQHGASGLLWSGARDRDLTSFQRENQQRLSELDSTLGQKRINELDNQVKQARGLGWGSIMEELMAAARARHEQSGY